MFFTFPHLIHRKKSDQSYEGLFLLEPRRAGEEIYFLPLKKTAVSQVTDLETSRQPFCMERGYQYAPGQVFCPTPAHPLYWTNHSCDPTATHNWAKQEPRLVDVEEMMCVIIRALRDLDAGEEVTFDYSATVGRNEGEVWGTDWEMVGCQCGSEKCRGLIVNFARLDRSLQKKMMESGQVPQWILEEEKGHSL